jgi:hypothetical protein
VARTQYESKKISPDRRAVIDQANAICAQYAEQGLVLTLRQLYYQFVARDLVPNEQREYDRLGDICRDARMAGLMDWDYLIDRTRNLMSWKNYKGPQEALKELAEKYHRDFWAPQHQRIEVWVEKDAAIGVVESVCSANHVPYFSCRGYSSMSEMHEAAQRIRWHIEAGNQVTILHIGDHDPSGLDMTRDIQDRLRQFISRDWAGIHMGAGSWTRGEIRQSMIDHMLEKGWEVNGRTGLTAPWSVNRIALNVDQINRYNPPPNPAKTTDARFQRYVDETGLTDSWELDALEPSVMQDLIQDSIDAIRDDSVWADEEYKAALEKQALEGITNWWDEVASFVTQKGTGA